MNEKDFGKGLDNLIIDGLIKESAREDARFKDAMARISDEEFLDIVFQGYQLQTEGKPAFSSMMPEISETEENDQIDKIKKLYKRESNDNDLAEEPQLEEAAPLLRRAAASRPPSREREDSQPSKKSDRQGRAVRLIIAAIVAAIIAAIIIAWLIIQ